MKSAGNISLDHIAINVGNIDTAVEWYIDYFGASVAYQDDTWAMLHIAGGSLKLALTVASEHPPHVAFRVDDICDFPIGAEIKQHRDGSRYYYAQDPDGNTVEWICYK